MQIWTFEYEDVKRGYCVLQLTPSLESVAQFLQCTLCHVQSDTNTDLSELATAALQHLSDLGLVLHTKAEGDSHKLEVTKLGRAVFKGTGFQRLIEFCFITNF